VSDTEIPTVKFSTTKRAPRCYEGVATPSDGSWPLTVGWFTSRGKALAAIKSEVAA
jgi:hypothetical protein